jgi:hypothetical protein
LINEDDNKNYNDNNVYEKRREIVCVN